MNTEYANIVPAAFAGLGYDRLLIDEVSTIHLANPLPPVSKKTTLSCVVFCSSRPPDMPGPYNVNSSSGCVDPGSSSPGATCLRLDASSAVRRTLPSNHTLSANPLPPAVPDALRLACCLARRLTIGNPPLLLAPGSIP